MISISFSQNFAGVSFFPYESMLTMKPHKFVHNMISLNPRMCGQNSLLFQCDVSPCCSELQGELAKSSILGDLGLMGMQLLESLF
ncbi:hypothetical protein Y032_0024g930 [Ancylostoma ceylanicum]|uniref:Uncharacterized protein n=1 Tax=Ancylostoma ceylanicum TaxID=53326 RepID=A0A016UYN5_9BILA|nr:hypothetical protein Y032_0024g930 [Ancylostoma ceylanicum]